MPQIIKNTNPEQYNMHTKITLVAVDHDCPRGKKPDDCPLRDWLKEQALFTDCIKNFDNIELRPTEPLFRLARTPYVNAINEINQICKNCMEKTK